MRRARRRAVNCLQLRPQARFHEAVCRLGVVAAALLSAAPLRVALAEEPVASAVTAQGSLEHTKTAREIQKLDLEIAGLKAAQNGAHGLPAWATLALGFLGGAATTIVSVLGARRARIGELDQKVHEQRLGSYSHLVQAAASLAVYFPQSPQLSPQDCAKMGQEMSTWYFGGGGLLLSAAARDAYFRLARALTRASLSANLNVPTFPDDAAEVSLESIDAFRQDLTGLDDVESWRFGGELGPQQPPHRRFKDYVFLQRLASGLRTALSEDLRSRRRPW